MKNAQKVLGILLLVVGASTYASATPVGVPEIAPAAASSAIALVSGIALMIRTRKTKKK